MSVTHYCSSVLNIHQLHQLHQLHLHTKVRPIPWLMRVVIYSPAMTLSRLAFQKICSNINKKAKICSKSYLCTCHFEASPSGSILPPATSGFGHCSSPQNRRLPIDNYVIFQRYRYIPASYQYDTILIPRFILMPGC
jgi:hypothetical protein